MKKDKSTIKVYLDMDGVLADFDEGVRLLLGKGPKELPQKVMWKAIKNNELPFWLNLPPVKDYLKLVKYLKNNFEHIMILSSPGEGGENTVNGKMDWITDKDVHLPAIFRKDKQVYAEPNSLLIDDWSKNIEKWRLAGGQTLHYRDWKSAKKELELILKKESINV